MYGQIMAANKQSGDQPIIQRKGDYVKSDVIYSYDLDQVLEILKKTALQRGADASNEFYFSCLDRLDIIITERGSPVGKDEVVRILRELAYFRPRDYFSAEIQRKQKGLFTKSELQDDLLSVRHKQLIKKNSEKYQTLPGHVFSFLYENINKGMFKDLFTQYDEEQQSKLGKNIYEVMSIYI
jgi:hypothetical protein